MLHEIVEVTIKAMCHGALFLLNELQDFTRVEFGRQNHTRPGRKAHERPLINTKSMEEGQIHHDDVVLFDPDATGLIDDIAHDVVAMHDTLGETGSPRRVHDGRGVIGIDSTLTLVECRVTDLLPHGQHFLQAIGARILLGANDHQALQGGKRCQRQVLSGHSGEFRAEFLHHRQVIDRARTVSSDQGTVSDWRMT